LGAERRAMRPQACHWLQRRLLLVVSDIRYDKQTERGSLNSDIKARAHATFTFLEDREHLLFHTDSRDGSIAPLGHVRRRAPYQREA
jgi:hypothetical protein